MMPRPPGSTLFPYTTLFRSRVDGRPPAANFLTDIKPSVPDEVVIRPIEDDREHLREGDRVLLIIEDDLKFARIMLGDRKSTRLNSSHRCISYAVFCLKKKIL